LFDRFNIELSSNFAFKNIDPTYLARQVNLIA